MVSVGYTLPQPEFLVVPATQIEIGSPSMTLTGTSTKPECTCVRHGSLRTGFPEEALSCRGLICNCSVSICISNHCRSTAFDALLGSVQGSGMDNSQYPPRRGSHCNWREDICGRRRLCVTPGLSSKRLRCHVSDRNGNEFLCKVNQETEMCCSLLPSFARKQIHARLKAPPIFILHCHQQLSTHL